MATETRTIKASCLCGKASYDLTLPTSEFPMPCYWCNCNSCRHKTGAMALSIVNPPFGWKPPQDLWGHLTGYKFSDRLTMYFCSTCGCSVITDCARSVFSDKGQHYDIMTGTLEKFDEVVEHRGYEYLCDTLDGGFADFLPTLNGRHLDRWLQRPNQSDRAPLNWQSPSKPTINPKPDDKLYCHCHCNGVQFYLSRPSARSKKAAGGWPDLIIPYHSTEPRPDHSEWWLRSNGKNFLAGNCACNSCRLDTGSEIQSWCFIPTVDISLDEAGEQPFKLPWGTLKAYESSKGVTRYHCGKCGASVFFTSEERTDLVDVAVGLLEAEEGSRAESWLEWRMNRVSFREDAVGRADELVEALEKGQQAWTEGRNK